jgi:hypothetical protein
MSRALALVCAIAAPLVAAHAKGKDPFAACAPIEEAARDRGTKAWTCGEVMVVSVDVPAPVAAEGVQRNLRRFPESFPPDAKKDASDVTIDGKKYRSMRVTTTVPQKGAVFSQLVVVGVQPSLTRLLTCTAPGAQVAQCQQLIGALVAKARAEGR